MVARPGFFGSFNSQAFLESSCCLAFSALVTQLIVSGQYLDYVTPRMKPYLWFAAAVMLVWSCVGFGRLLTPQNKTRSARCFALTIPILLLLLPHRPLSVADLSFSFARGNSFGSQLARSGTDALSPSLDGYRSDLSIADGLTYDSLYAGEFDGEVAADSLDLFGAPGDLGERYDVQANVSAAELSGLDPSTKTITVDNGEFYQWIEEIFTNPDQYAGFSIKMTGFVFKDPEVFLPDEFVPARLVMSCCVADLIPLGMICKYEKNEELLDESWVTVEGVIVITEENGYREPQARITGVSPAEEIKGYIYPNY
jgi:putative membrane protein